jgi:hypothetical protein
MERWTVAGFASATAAAIATPVAARTNTWVGVGVTLACAASLPWIARALPASLDGAFGRRRVASLLWVLLATVGVLQMGRLSAFMADASREWGATVPDPLATHHQCMSAYVYAADLSARGARNLYDAGWYPMFDPPGPTCRLVATPVQGLSRWVADPYEYPPPFLVLPRAALALTHSYDAIRAWWFVLQALGFVAGALMLAAWIGGREGVVFGMLIPALLASLETMFNFQFGQFHVVAILLAGGAMGAFHERRHALGGALLAVAIWSKLFPAVLLVVLLARREWRALGWTAAFGVVFALVGLAVLGPDPYRAFIAYQLPRLASGAAFEFTHNGAHEVFLISRNFSIAGLGAKLRVLGAPDAWISAVGIAPWIYLVGLLALAWFTARARRTRVGQLILWFSLLNLAALRSPIAPSAYVLAPVLWVLALLATEIRGRRALVAALAAGWIVVVGPPPLPDRADLIVGLACQAVVIALSVGAVWWPRPPEAMSQEIWDARLATTAE